MNNQDPVLLYWSHCNCYGTQFRYVNIITKMINCIDSLHILHIELKIACVQKFRFKFDKGYVLKLDYFVSLQTQKIEKHNNLSYFMCDKFFHRILHIFIYYCSVSFCFVKLSIINSRSETSERQV